MSKELQAGYEFTKSQLARLKLLEKQNAELIEALSELIGAIRFTPIGTRALYALRASDILLTEIKEQP